MADDYTRQSDVFRAHDVSGKKLPILVVGAHVRVYKGVQSVVVTDANVHNLTVPGGALFAEITMEGWSGTSDFIRYWHGATDPTSTSGVELYDRDTIVSADPSTFTAIKGSTGAGGTLRVEYFAYE